MSGESLLNHTVPGQVSRRQLTSVLCPFFLPVTDNLLFLNKSTRGKNPRKTDARTCSIFGLFAYKSDMPPTELPRLVFGFQKMCGWEGAIDGTHIISDMVLKND